MLSFSVYNSVICTYFQIHSNNGKCIGYYEFENVSWKPEVNLTINLQQRVCIACNWHLPKCFSSLVYLWESPSYDRKCAVVSCLFFWIGSHSCWGILMGFHLRVSLVLSKRFDNEWTTTMNRIDEYYGVSKEGQYLLECFD